MRPLLILLMLAWHSSLPIDICQAADSLEFAIIQPGQPGTAQDAQPVMNQFAAYLQAKLTSKTSIAGCYFNAPEEALNFLRTHRPVWGIVSRGFFASHAAEFGMVPIASTRPGGFSKDLLRLAVRRDASDNWEALRGTVAGSMLFDTQATACELFGQPQQRLPFALVGTFQPLKSVRKVSAGKVAGVVLDRRQYQSLQSMPLVESVKIVLTSKELPTSPVVWFGRQSPLVAELTQVLMAMREDPGAVQLLKTLQTDGFGPVDANLQEIQGKIINDSSCP